MVLAVLLVVARWTQFADQLSFPSRPRCGVTALENIQSRVATPNTGRLFALLAIMLIETRFHVFSFADVNPLARVVNPIDP